MTLRTTLVDGVRTHTLWVPKDTSAMSGTVMRGAAMVKGTIGVQPHVTEGYQKVEYVLTTERGSVTKGTDLLVLINDEGSVSMDYMYNGMRFLQFYTNPADGDGLVKLEVHKTIGDGVDPEPELVGLDQLDGLNSNTKRVMEDPSGFGLGGRAKYHDYWTDLHWQHGSGFWTARQDKTSGQYLIGINAVHGTGDYSFGVMGRKDVVFFQTRENGGPAVQFEAYHHGNLDKLIEALTHSREDLAALKEALEGITV